MDTKLVKEVALFLTTQLRLYTGVNATTKDAFICMHKCLSSDAPSLHIVEPVDVLLNVCVLVCTKGLETIRNHSLHAAFSLLVSIKNTVKAIAKTYLERDYASIFDLYRNQCDSLLRSQTAGCVDVLQRVQLGVFDAVIEFLVSQDSYTDIVGVLAKRDATSILIRYIYEKIWLYTGQYKIK